MVCAGKNTNLTLGIILVILFSAVYKQGISQSIYSTTADTAIITEYAEYNGMWELLDPSEQDSIYIFCSDGTNAGILTAPFDSCTYQWYKYIEVTQLSELLEGENSQTISDLSSGGYKLRMICSGDTSCFNSWVFVNETFIDVHIEDSIGQNVGNEMVGHESFSIHGSSDPVSDMTVYNPPSSNFIVGPSTEIEVCFSATHTWVSNLGFYLVAPGYGPGQANPSIPGDYGTVELLPYITNCNNGDDVDHLCFTTSLDTAPYVCDVPLTGFWGSAGLWDYIYGFDAGMGGWSVQIYDCVGADVGHLTEVSISFTDNTQCGTSTIYYNSGPISSDINDMSCDATTASIYTVPLAQPYSYTISNSITTKGWYRCDGTPLTTPLLEVEVFDIEDLPDTATSYVYRSIDNIGCMKEDSVKWMPYPTKITRPEIDPVDALRIFPNPANGNFTLEFFYNDNTNISIFLYDAQGRNVYDEEFEINSGINKKKIDASYCKSGIYTLMMIGNKRVATKRFVIK